MCYVCVHLIKFIYIYIYINIYIYLFVCFVSNKVLLKVELLFSNGRIKIIRVWYYSNNLSLLFYERFKMCIKSIIPNLHII